MKLPSLPDDAHLFGISFVDGMGIERSEMRMKGPKDMIRGPYSMILKMLQQGEPRQ